MSDAISRAIYETLLKVDPHDDEPGSERNIVDGLFAIAKAIHSLTQAIEYHGMISNAVPRKEPR